MKKRLKGRTPSRLLPHTFMWTRPQSHSHPLLGSTLTWPNTPFTGDRSTLREGWPYPGPCREWLTRLGTAMLEQSTSPSFCLRAVSTCLAWNIQARDRGRGAVSSRDQSSKLVLKASTSRARLSAHQLACEKSILPRKGARASGAAGAHLCLSFPVLP